MIIQGWSSKDHLAGRDLLSSLKNGHKSISNPALADSLLDSDDLTDTAESAILDVAEFASEKPAEKAVAKETPEQRTERLAEIRSRIKKGFYNADVVLEDLSDSFASVFNKLS